MHPSDSDRVLRTYYEERAPVYDRVYGYPERQSDLRDLEAYVASEFAGRDVLEVAAGTGYWTPHIGSRARSVMATDASAEALSRIGERGTRAVVETRVADAYTLAGLGRRFDAAFAGLWFSHVPVERRRDWFSVLHRNLESGAVVVLIDNSMAQCGWLPITHTDAAGNTYQDRRTDAGHSYRILKNFPSSQELLALVAEVGSDCAHQYREHFWSFRYVFR